MEKQFTDPGPYYYSGGGQYYSSQFVRSLSEAGNYGYDPNGRRISLSPKMNNVSQPTINYGYDCADELISMSNNGSSLQSCSSSNYIANGGTSTQVGINYDLDGNPNYTVVDGVQTVLATLASPRDADERVKVETFQAYPGPYSYGGLTYNYDADGHLIDKGGTLATVNMPAAVSTASYSATDQVSSWKGVSSTTDNASNITSDPASGLTLMWNARNQAGNVGGFSESYDALGRRETNSAGLSFEHDSSAVIGWSETGGSYNFTTSPGGGALAGSFTANGNTTTWVPLIDASGSTIALVNAAATGSAPATTYTYDPSGTPTLSGATNFWPFLYQGIEQEFFDAPYYYTGGGQFYSPQLVRSLSETSQTSSQGTGGGPAGNAIAAPSGGGFSPNFSQSPQESGEALGVGVGALAGTQAAIDAYNVFLLGAEGFSGGIATPAVVVGLIAEALFDLFDDLFGGSSGPPPTPRKLLHQRHPLYPVILGIPDGLDPTEGSAGPEETCGDLRICTIWPLADPKVLEIPQASTPTPVPHMTWDQLKREYNYLHEQGRPPLYIEQQFESEGVPEYIAKMASVGQFPNLPGTGQTYFHWTPTPVPP